MQNTIKTPGTGTTLNPVGGVPQIQPRTNPYYQQSVISVFGLAPSPTPGNMVYPYNSGVSAIKMLALLLQYDKQKVVALCRKYGADVNKDSSDEKISAAVVSLMRQRQFRSELKFLWRQHCAENEGTYKKFTGGDDFMNACGCHLSFTADDNYMDETFARFTGKDDFMNANGLIGPMPDNSGSSNQQLKLSDILTPQRIGNVFDAGLELLNKKLGSQADQATLNKMIQLEQSKAANAMNNGSGGSQKDTSGTVKIVIGLGVVAVLSAALYFAFRKK